MTTETIEQQINQQNRQVANDETVQWFECKAAKNYEIADTYPYPIRHKHNHSPLSETITNNGYVQCFMNRQQYLKHRLIAQQFINNPNNYRFVIHLNYQCADNHIDNLCWSKCPRHL